MQNAANLIDSAPHREDIAQRIRAARARIGMTRKQLASASQTSERYLAQLEAGAGNPSVDVLLTIANALDIPPAELLPSGGERDASTALAFASLRRFPHERLAEALATLERSHRGAGGKGQRIALVGLRGAGKSSLGRALAERNQVPFFEVSKEVERVYGSSIRLLMDIGGQAALRRYEAETIKKIFDENPAAVIATPGAIVSDSVLYETLLASAWSVWLEAKPEDHMERVMAQGDFRPMADNPAPMQDLKSILSARSADYARADARLDTSAQSFEKTLNKLAAIAKKLTT